MGFLSRKPSERAVQVAEQEGRQAWSKFGEDAENPYPMSYPEFGLRVHWFRGYFHERTKSRVSCMRGDLEVECCGV